MKANLPTLCLIAVALGSTAPPTHAAALKTTKLYSTPQPTTAVNPNLGTSVATSDQWILAGEIGNDDAYVDAGAVQVFSARTGRRIRTLSPDDAEEPRLFGASVALFGDLAVVGAPFDGEDGLLAGKAYLFNVRTGKQLFILRPDDPAANRAFGFKVAISGNLILIGALLDDTLGNNAGAAYVFDATTGTQLHKLTASDGAASHEFGSAVALSGKTALIGAPHANGGLAGCGSAYVFDASTGVETKKLASAIAFGTEDFGAAVALQGSIAMIGAPNYPMLAANAGAVFFFNTDTGDQLASVLNHPYGAAGDLFGYSLAFEGGVALAGAPTTDSVRGAAYQIDLRTGTVVERFQAADGEPDDSYGMSLAIHAGHAVISAPGDDDLGTSSGSLYWTRTLAATPDLFTDFRTTAPAPGVSAAAFRQISHGWIDRQGSVMGAATLSGPGAAGGRGQGAWSSIGTPGFQGLVLRSRDPLDSLGASYSGLRAGRVTALSMNQAGLGVLRVNLAGPGAAGNQAILRDNGTDLLPIVRTGVPLGFLGGASIRRVSEVAQTRDVISPRVAMPSIRRNPGFVDATNDSLLLFANSVTGTLVDASALESANAPGGGFFGQILPRVAYVDTTAVFTSYRLTPGTPPVQALFRRQPFGTFDTVVDAGVAAPGAGGALFRTFIGEGVSTGNQALIRATLTGPTVTPASNEGLWHQGFGLVARKGSQVPGEASGVEWKRFLGFWPVATQGMIIHATVGGSGHPTRQGLWVLQEDGSLLNLLRQGNHVGTPDGARLRRILRVDVDPIVGSYSVLATLTGPASRNQALFAGNLAVGHPVNATALRLPRLLLRKGTAIAEAGGNTWTARSLFLPPTTDACGSGAKGHGTVINAGGQVALRIRRSDATTALARSQESALSP
jgi:outer membrane protein assembly factor BamB